MPSRTVETTIRNIYLLAEKHTGGALTVDQIANSLEVAPATASSIVNGLSEAKLVEVGNDQTVRLTEEGHKLGIGMVRRHRLLEYFLVEVLKMDWSEVHEEAEALEHAVSERLLEHLDTFLGEPRFDPHGDPIPTREGHLHARHMSQLSLLPPGQKAKVAHIADQQPDFLGFCRQLGLLPGTVVSVSEGRSPTGILKLEISGHPAQQVGISDAKKIWVEH